MEAGCYVLHLYCDKNPKHTKGWEYTGGDRSECVQQARRKDNWTFHHDGTHTCPECRIPPAPHGKLAVRQRNRAIAWGK